MRRSGSQASDQKPGNTTMGDYLNTTGETSFEEETSNGMNDTYIQEDVLGIYSVQVFFFCVYAAIFILGIFGNILVCYVVGRNKAMQTVTNFFISNLAIGDILLCSLAVPFTPGYFFAGSWRFGKFLCHIVGYTQGVSVYISSLTLMSIAIDRYFVIMYPFKPRMKILTCFFIVLCIWCFALLATLPYGLFLQHDRVMDEDSNKLEFETCEETWDKGTRLIFSVVTAVMQFIIPFSVISFCYVRVSIKLGDRARSKPGSKNSKKEAIDRERKRRTNRMLIAMVTIFGVSWLPISLVNLLNDLYEDVDSWEYYNLCFFSSHALAMSSTSYNCFLYAWLNENFRKEFKQVLPCFSSALTVGTRSMRFVSDKTCNGNETVQESVMPSSSHAAGTGLAHRVPVKTLETIEEQISNSQATENNFEQVTATYCSTTNQVEIYMPRIEFDSCSPDRTEVCTPQIQLHT